MKPIPCKILVCFLCFDEKLNLSNAVIFGYNFLYLSKKLPKKNLKFFSYQILTSIKRWGKQLQSKATFMTFCYIIALLFKQNTAKGLRVTKNVKEVKFGRTWDEL